MLQGILLNSPLLRHDFISDCILVLDVDECKSGSHKCSQLCHNEKGSYKCSCYDGYILNGNGYSCDGM